MTNQQHPITPPEDLLQQLRHNMGTWLDQITIAYQAGADQELEACKQYMHDQDWFMSPTLRMTELHNTRRPKPPSLKKQALDSLQKIGDNNATYLDADIIRRALEALPND
jgi:hypothetical protein